MGSTESKAATTNDSFLPFFLQPLSEQTLLFTFQRRPDLLHYNKLSHPSGSIFISQNLDVYFLNSSWFPQHCYLIATQGQRRGQCIMNNNRNKVHVRHSNLSFTAFPVLHQDASNQYPLSALLGPNIPLSGEGDRPVHQDVPSSDAEVNSSGSSSKPDTDHRHAEGNPSESPSEPDNDDSPHPGNGAARRLPKPFPLDNDLEGCPLDDTSMIGYAASIHSTDIQFTLRQRFRTRLPRRCLGSKKHTNYLEDLPGTMRTQPRPPAMTKMSFRHNGKQRSKLLRNRWRTGEKDLWAQH